MRKNPLDFKIASYKSYFSEERERSRHPVLLIHGLYDTTIVFNRMSAILKDLGWTVHSIDLIPNNGSHLLEKLAMQVGNYIDTVFPPEQPIDLIGFSMGGIVTRYYLQRLGGINRVKRYINISAPNNGTLTAYALPLPGIIQMRPNSPFLKDLNDDRIHLLEKINSTTIWTPCDVMIVPAKSSKMSVGKEVQLPVLFHAWMLNDYRSIAAVVDALCEPLKE
jgi:triacylglycerol lipase